MLRIDEILAAGQKRKTRRKKKAAAAEGEEAIRRQGQEVDEGEGRCQAEDPEEAGRQGGGTRGDRTRARRSGGPGGGRAACGGRPRLRQRTRLPMRQPRRLRRSG